MFYFDGNFKSKPVINASGSSKIKSRDQLIHEATSERIKRETEKRQNQSALKIQSALRSYLARKHLKVVYRQKFDELFAQASTPDHILSLLLPYFVNIFDNKLDLERLKRINQTILQNKETFIQILIKNKDKSNILTFAKYLTINLKQLNTNPQAYQVPLRLIEYFTETNVYSSSTNKSEFICNHLIKNGYLDNITEFCLKRVPNEPGIRNVPILSSICNLYMRIFLFLGNSTHVNENIVRAICKEWFSKLHFVQLRHYLFEEIANNLNDLIRKNDLALLKKLILFLETFNSMYTNKKVHLINDESSYNHIYSEQLCNLFCILKIFEPLVDKLRTNEFATLVNAIATITQQIPTLNCDTPNLFNYLFNLNDDNKMDDDVLMDESNEINDQILSDILKIIDSKIFSDKLNMFIAKSSSDNNTLLYNISCICYFVLIKSKFKIHQSIFLRTIAFNRLFLSSLWKMLCQLKTKKNEIYIMHLMASGTSIEINDTDLFKIVPSLYTFSSFYSLFLLTMLDEEFLKGEAIFTKEESTRICSTLKEICLGIIRLMHAESKPVFTSYYREASLQGTNDLDTKIKTIHYYYLFQSCSNLVQRLYTRDTRNGFCPDNLWLSNTIKVNASRLHTLFELDTQILSRAKFGSIDYLIKGKQFDLETFKPSVSDLRHLTVLQELPFVVEFKERVEIFEICNFSHSALNDHTIQPVKIRIRRDYLYEDAYDELSRENVQNLRSARVSVEMINALGLDEAGIDGGGLFREFILQLLETGFDPNRGFFILTSDGFLYPNPNVRMLQVNNYQQHYYFLGRILAKAIQCKLLSQLKFADFFLQKILSRLADGRLDIDYLASLDPQIYKNLVYLKRETKENINDLNLNFAVDLSEFGETSSVELKPGGKDILVTNENKIEYIHLLADYKLNRQINEQVISFRNGMSDIIDLEFLRLFSSHELQNLISGEVDYIDVLDWQKNTVYAGDLNQDHASIKTFWKVVEDFDEHQKRQLLKFATSRSRPPLFGFKNLIPHFAIHSSGSEDRLPSASTCLNLLKLPPISDYKQLKAKLLCAIESDAGFELS